MQQITIRALTDMDSFGHKIAQAILSELNLTSDTKSSRQTDDQSFESAEEQNQALTLPVLLALKGELGAGKTTLTKAIAKGLGVKAVVNSPTFTLVKSYETSFGLPLHHIDAYRLEGSEHPSGLEEMLEDESITIIEWPEYLLELSDYDPLWIEIEKEAENIIEPEKRIITIHTDNAQYTGLEKRLLA